MRQSSQGENAWWMAIVLANAFFVPLLVVPVKGLNGIGAVDVFSPLAIISLLILRRVAAFHLSHFALAGFVFAALISLTMIDDTDMALRCGVRWVRLVSIVIPFYFGLVMPVTERQLNRTLKTFGIGGFLAVFVGILLYNLQVEIVETQQKLWMIDGFQLRAGGLIGNSGPFGHLTATWCVITVGAICLLSQSRHRFALASAVVLIAVYTVYIASSRATMLHLIAALSGVAVLYKMSDVRRKQLLAYMLIGSVVLTLLITTTQMTDVPLLGESDAISANLQRFVPGLNGGDLTEFTSNRSNTWPTFVAMMSDSWLFGTGYKSGVQLHEQSPDNSYLSLMLETGVLGFLCMSLFTISIFHRLGVLYLSNDRYAAIMLPVCVGQLVHGLTSDVYTFWISMPVVYLLLGFVIQRRVLDQN